MAENPTYEELEQRIRELEMAEARWKKTEADLRESRNKYRTLFEAANDAIFVACAESGVIQDANQEAERLTGRKRHEIIGLHFTVLHPPEQRSTAMHNFEKDVRRKGENRYTDLMVQHADGREIPVQISPSLIHIKEKPCVFGIFRDVSEQKEKEETLRKHAGVLSAVTEPVSYINRNYIYEIVNDARAKRVGKSKEDFIGRHIAEIHGQEHFEQTLRGCMDRCFAGETVAFREWFRVPDGTKAFLDVSYYPVYDETGAEIIGAAVYTRERTAQKHAEDALRRSEARYRAIFQNQHVVMMVIDPDTGAIKDANPAAAGFYGRSHEELIGMNIKDINTLSPEEVEEKMRAARQNQRGFFQFRHRLRDGTVRDVEVSSGPVEYDEKKLLYSIVRDVTRRVQAEKALKESEARFRLIFEQATAGIAIASADGRFIDANQALCDMLGYTREELLGMTVRDVTHPDDRDLSAQADRSILSGEKDAYRLEKRYRHKDGRPIWADLSSSVIRDDNGSIRYAIGVVVDITEQKRVETALKEREAFLGTLLNAIPTPVFYKDKNGRYLGVNDAFETFFGELNDGLIGKTVFDIVPHRLAEIYYAKDNELFESGGEQRYETQVETAKNEIRDVIFNKSIYRDDAGAIAGIIGAVLDITERKGAETALKNALAEKEVLLREIHHRVKNNMQAIISLLRMHSRKNKSPQVKTVFDDCRSRIEAMSLIHETLYQSDRLERIELSTYLKRLCRGLSRVYHAADGEGVAMTADDCHVALDMDRSVAVGMVIAELISNAYKHAFPPGRGGCVSVKMTAPAPETVEVTVADDGKGLPPDFDIQKPSSLGMRLVAGAVTRELGGTIDVESGNGARFIIRFNCRTE